MGSDFDAGLPDQVRVTGSLGTNRSQFASRDIAIHGPLMGFSLGEPPALASLNTRPWEARRISCRPDSRVPQRRCACTSSEEQQASLPLAAMSVSNSS